MAEIGVAVDTLSLPNGAIHAQLEAMELIEALKDSSDDEGRILHLVNVERAALSTRADVSSVAGDVMKIEQKLDAIDEMNAEKSEPSAEEQQEQKLDVIPEDSEESQETKLMEPSLEQTKENKSNAEDATDQKEESDSSRTVVLPTGRLRVAFKGKNPPACCFQSKEEQCFGWREH